MSKTRIIGQDQNLTAADIDFVPNGSIAATDVQAAIQEVRDEAAGGYTDEQAQDAVGAMVADTSTVNVTYTDATPELKWDVLPAGIKLDDLGTPDDNTDLNASTSAHGLLKKLSNTATEYMDGTGNWSTPAGSGGGISSGTSFPGSPSNNDLFYRTDRDLLYFYDGTRWLTVQQFETGPGWVEAAAPLAATATLARWPVRADYGTYLERWNIKTFQTNGTPASNNMSVVLARVTSANAATTLTSFTTNADSANTWVAHDSSGIAGVLDASAVTLRVVATETGTVTGFIAVQTITYRLIG